MLHDWRFITLVGVGLVAAALWNGSFFTNLNSITPTPGTHMTAPPVSASAGLHESTRFDHTTFPLQAHIVSVTPVQGAWTDVIPQDLSSESPFGKPTTVAPQGAPTWQSDFTVSAVLTGGPKNIAVINHEPVAVGDTVGGLPVTEIALGWVVLGTGDRRRVIIVD